MALRTQFAISPRFSIEELATELTLQTVVNELRIIESSFQGISFDSILDASGKQVLGAGVLVGITYQGKNHQLAFDSVRVPVQIGTVTTPSVAPIDAFLDFIFLDDSAALFETNLVKPGSTIMNWTDESVADVLEVISEIRLRVRVPTGPGDNSYDSADRYSVFNHNKRVIRAGNFTAVDDMDLELDGLIPTFGTYAIIEKDTSAALIDASTMAANILLATKVLRNKKITDPVTGVFTVFDDDGTTVLISGNLFEDAPGVQAYRGQGAERQERLE